VLRLSFSLCSMCDVIIDVHSESVLIQSLHRWQFDILAFSSTLILVCKHMSSGLSQAVLKSCTSFAAFHNLLCHVYQLLIVALVLSWLYNGIATLAGVPACLLNHLQSILNARSIAGLCRSELITDALSSFHWLRASKRIMLKLAHHLPGSSWDCTLVFIGSSAVHDRSADETPSLYTTSATS